MNEDLTLRLGEGHYRAIPLATREVPVGTRADHVINVSWHEASQRGITQFLQPVVHTPAYAESRIPRPELGIPPAVTREIPVESSTPRLEDILAPEELRAVETVRVRQAAEKLGLTVVNPADAQVAQPQPETTIVSPEPATVVSEDSSESKSEPPAASQRDKTVDKGAEPTTPNINSHRGVYSALVGAAGLAMVAGWQFGIPGMGGSDAAAKVPNNPVAAKAFGLPELDCLPIGTAEIKGSTSFKVPYINAQGDAAYFPPAPLEAASKYNITDVDMKTPLEACFDEGSVSLSGSGDKDVASVDLSKVTIRTDFRKDTVADNLSTTDVANGLVVPALGDETFDNEAFGYIRHHQALVINSALNDEASFLTTAELVSAETINDENKAAISTLVKAAITRYINAQAKKHHKTVSVSFEAGSLGDISTMYLDQRHITSQDSDGIVRVTDSKIGFVSDKTDLTSTVTPAASLVGAN